MSESFRSSKVFSGKLTSDQTVYNVNEETEERISTFRFMRGKDSTEGKEIILGDIVAHTRSSKAR